MQQKISSRVSAFISESGGSNCFLLKGENKNALVDTSTAENRQAVLELLSKQGRMPEDISLILYTHGHADHFGLNSLFPNAQILMHEADAKRLSAQDAEFACTQLFPGASLPKVSTFLKDRQEIDLGKLVLRVLHSPGHTEGSLCFLLEEDSLLFSGDTLFAEGFGRTDLSGGDREKMLKSLQKLQKIPFGMLLPGHGPVLVGEKENRARLERTIATASTNAFL